MTNYVVKFCCESLLPTELINHRPKYLNLVLNSPFKRLRMNQSLLMFINY